MSSDPRIFVVVPAFCEERLIQRTILSIPGYVERIIVVDDASTDATCEQVRALADPRVFLVCHAKNRGVGAAIYTGYQAGLSLGADILVVMAGDNQMHGDDLRDLLVPLLNDTACYVKGNRHLHERARDMPWLRRSGSRLLALVTSWAMGVRIGDSQCGYTALRRSAALQLDFSDLWPRYGYPNDLLIALAKRGVAVAEVAVRPVYADETSGLRPWHMLSILTVIGRSWWREHRRPTCPEPSYSNEQVIG